MNCLSVNLHSCNCLLILLFLLRSAKGQYITLEYVTTSTSCDNRELLEGKDNIILNGTIDLQNASSAGWKLNIPIEFWENSSTEFHNVCTVKESNICSNNGKGCYYTSKKENKLYTFTVNITANKTYSNGIFSAQLAPIQVGYFLNDTAHIPVIHGKEETGSSTAHCRASNSGAMSIGGADYQWCIMFIIISLICVFFS